MGEQRFRDMKNSLAHRIEQRADPAEPKDGGHNETMIQSLDEIQARDYTARIPITLSARDWLYLRMAAANRRQTMGEFIADALTETDYMDQACGE
jgi:hypothetical protein